jgi:hypothetical protein
MGKERKVYNVLVGKPEETTQRPRRRWENGIKMDLIKTGRGEWIWLAREHSDQTLGCGPMESVS